MHALANTLSSDDIGCGFALMLPNLAAKDTLIARLKKSRSRLLSAKQAKNQY
jgi:hypothetical protein